MVLMLRLIAPVRRFAYVMDAKSVSVLRNEAAIILASKKTISPFLFMAWKIAGAPRRRVLDDLCVVHSPIERYRSKNDTLNAVTQKT